MILELFKSITEKSIFTAKEFGHIKESIAIRQRYDRCSKDWQNHISNCHKTIQNFIAQSTAEDTILILGSGPLNEIPIDLIISHFKRVVLVDAIHPSEVLKKYSKFKNVEFIFHDISETEINFVHNRLLINTPSRFLNEKFDYVISANLLSQIPFHFKLYLEKNYPDLQEDSIENICTKISMSHINYLNKFNSNVLLITDVETQIIYPERNIVEIETPYHENLLPDYDEEWPWILAPIGEKSNDYYLQMKVVSIRLKSK